MNLNGLVLEKHMTSTTGLVCWICFRTFPVSGRPIVMSWANIEDRMKKAVTHTRLNTEGKFSQTVFLKLFGWRKWDFRRLAKQTRV